MRIGKTLIETNKIIEDLPKEQRLKFVKDNLGAIKEQKKESIKTHVNTHFSAKRSNKTIKPIKTRAGKSITKQEFKEEEDLKAINVTIVGNSCWVFDSHYDVHKDGCWTKTLEESQHKFFHTQDHSSRSSDKVGDPVKTYAANVSTKELGLDTPIESVECLLMDSDVYRTLNKNIFTQYGLGMIKEHSVGMYYVRLDFAANDPENVEEHKIWIDNIDKIANREAVEEYGFFWLVTECKLVEISAVTRGSNPYTPALETEDKNEHNKGDKDKVAPSDDTQPKKAFIFEVAKQEAAKSTSHKHKQIFFNN